LEQNGILRSNLEFGPINFCAPGLRDSLLGGFAEMHSPFKQWFGHSLSLVYANIETGPDVLSGLFPRTTLFQKTGACFILCYYSNMIHWRNACVVIVAVLSFTNIALVFPGFWSEPQQRWLDRAQAPFPRLENESGLFTSDDALPSRRVEDFLSLGDLPNESFGACLKIMDDNHWLVEWIAYHWFVLPLRHLVVYVDPQSATTPQPILDRWKKYIDIHVMSKEYWRAKPRRTNPNIPGVQEHRGPHSLFIQDCMQYYRRRNWTWIVITDTDEFIKVCSPGELGCFFS